jgi:DNA (cytosine-5)-methyltransferase 1
MSNSLVLQNPSNLKMISHRPKAIDLFSGAGGMSLGFEQAGFDICAAVDIDPVHACVHHFNFPQSATICGSISDLSGKDILDKAEVSSKENIDLVFGGAPCQGYSMIGQRALDDPRNSLVRDYIRILREIRPKAFVFENVKGITLGKHRQILDEFIDEINAIGYEIISPWKILNANRYGVPQSRERLIIIGFLRGSKGEYLYPEQKTKPQMEGTDLFVELTPTCENGRVIMYQ